MSKQEHRYDRGLSPEEERWRHRTGRNLELGVNRELDALKRELLCRFLPPRLMRMRNPFFLRKNHEHHAEVSRRLRAANLVGVAVGSKVSENRITGELAVCALVTKKRTLGRLGRKERVPKSINGVATDVIPIGSFVQHTRPVALGYGLSRLDTGTGSLGCLLRIAGKEGVFLLSAAHVLAPNAQAGRGDVIVEPPHTEPGAQPLATLEDWVPLDLDGGLNRIDAAVARLDQPTDVIARPPFIGPLQPQPMAPYIYQSVRKFGATTGHTLGVITHRQADLSASTSTGDSIRYGDMWMLLGAGGTFSQPGDSGALVVDALTNRPVGLVIAGATQQPSCGIL